MKVIITGSTGMVGKGVLLECLAAEEVTEVLLLNRSPIDIGHPKMKEILLRDFFDLSEIEDQMTGYDACFFCLGISSTGMKEEQYSKITYDLTLNFAQTLIKKNSDMTFIYVSGQGTSTEMNSKMMWANVKGKTENELLSLGFKNAYMFRPGLILPLKGIRSKSWYQIFYDLMKPLYPLFMKSKNITDTERLGKAMINITLKGSDKQHLEPVDINQLAVG